MKKIALLVFVMLFGRLISTAQYQEFQVYGNGLIYDDHTMNKLGLIIDSLNLRFKSCDLSHPYYALPQGKAHVVHIPNKEARKKIREGISYNEYKAFYPLSIRSENNWIVKHTYTDYKDVPMVEYASLPGISLSDIELKNTKQNNIESGWIITGDRAMYLEGLEAKPISEKYARLIQYVDCMIDTSAQIYLPRAEAQYGDEVDSGSDMWKFLDWVNKYPDEPEYPEYGDYDSDDFDSVYQVYLLEHATWTENRLIAKDKKMRSSVFRKSQLMDARDEALATGISNADLEFYIARYLSKEDALTMKRKRRVVGMCSMDQRPRNHAIQICLLSAETQQWDIFLRSHLDIMNDRFDRMSDGSYAWEARNTYLKELEELGINAVDLLVGTCFRSISVNENHYNGSINRIGRALAEAKDKDAVEDLIFQVISDEEVDIYNRLLFTYLFSHYNHHLEDDGRKDQNEERFEQVFEDLPEYIKEAWKDE